MGLTDWRELLDDPEVERVVDKVVGVEGRRLFGSPRDALILDDLLSFCWDKAVDVAQAYPGEPGEGFHAYLYVALRNTILHRRRDVWGHPGSARNAAYQATFVSLEAEVERHATTGHSEYLFSRQLVAADPLAVLIRRETLEAALRHATARRRLEGTATFEASPYCVEPLCLREAKIKGRCATHYARWREQWTAPTCSVDGCPNGATSRGLCNKHYKRATAARCAMKGCSKVARVAGYCDEHEAEARARGEVPERPRTKYCNVPGCTAPHYARGLCEPHYRADAATRAAPCAVPGCEKASRKRGMCQTHYNQARR